MLHISILSATEFETSSTREKNILSEKYFHFFIIVLLHSEKI